MLVLAHSCFLSELASIYRCWPRAESPCTCSVLCTLQVKPDDVVTVGQLVAIMRTGDGEFLTPNGPYVCFT